jgi:general secretion pathway protein I
MTRRKGPEGSTLRAARGAHGFTLIEVLVALVIVVLGMSALMGSLTSAADGATYLRDKVFAQWVALNQVATVRLQQQAPSLGETTGEVELANRKWSWQQRVSNLEYPGIVRIDVSVRPADAVAANGDKNQNWFVTITGVKGDAVASPSSAAPYGDITLSKQQQGAQGGPGLPGTNTPGSLPSLPASPGSAQPINPP